MTATITPRQRSSSPEERQRQETWCTLLSLRRRNHNLINESQQPNNDPCPGWDLTQQQAEPKLLPVNQIDAVHQPD